MLPLSQKLLATAGFKYDAIEQTWVVPVPLPPLVTVECHGGDGNVMDVLLEVHAVLDANTGAQMFDKVDSVFHGPGSVGWVEVNWSYGWCPLAGKN